MIGFLVVIALVVLFIIRAFVANRFAGLAEDKGYTNCHIWAWTFWLGLVGMLMVIAMPDKSDNNRAALKELLEQKKSMNEELTDTIE